MKSRVKDFIAIKTILWNDGMTVALAWFNNDVLVINNCTNKRIRNLIKKINNSKNHILENY